MRQRGLARRRLLRAGLGWAGLGVLSGCGVLPSPVSPQRTFVRLGVLSANGIGGTAAARGLVDGLRSAGWVQGENLRIENRFGQAPEALAVAVAELTAMNLDAIIAEGNSHVKALKSATAAIPIVMALGNDPVRTGLVASLARPGGNVTGLASLSAQLTEKRFELLKRALPRATRALCIWLPDLSGDAVDEVAIHAAGRKIGLETQIVGVQSPHALGEAFAGAVKDRIDAIVLLSDFISERGPLTWRSRVAATGLPVMSGNLELAREGTLLAYGPSIPELFRRAAMYVDKILRGAKPADLPVEQPTEFYFVVNEKVARASGLAIPDDVLREATEIVR